MSARPHRRARPALLLAALCIACQTPPPGDAAPELDARGRERIGRHALQDGRALQQEGRLEAAERVLRRGLQSEPGNAELARALAQVLDALGREEEARAAQARADAIDPPPLPLPTEAMPIAAGATVVALLESTLDRRLDQPGRWPETSVEEALRAHLARRLPDAVVERAAPENVVDAARWLVERGAERALSLRVDRADCRFSVKDGAIAMARLRFATATRDGSAIHTNDTAIVVENPAQGDDCIVLAAQSALEAVLETPAWRHVAAALPDETSTSWSTAALRPLFPGIGRHLERAIRHGRQLLNAGQLGEARSAFEDAARIDPEDPEILAWLDDSEKSLHLARELARSDPNDDPESLDPRLSPAQRAAAQVALERERRRRDELLGALAVLDEDVRAPAASALSLLRPVEIRSPGAFGPSLARRRAGGRIEARAAYAPDGQVLARYYFGQGAAEPLLREEDTNGDGTADRWIAYSGAARREIFEDGSGRGRPDLHLVFAEGGEPLERVELDLSGDERPERVFHYTGGRLHAEQRDTNGDGRLDRFDRFDAGGLVDVREEDLDGDGAIDVRSEFQGGKLVRREVSARKHLPES